MSGYEAVLRADLAGMLSGVQEVADHLGLTRRGVLLLVRRGVLRPLTSIDNHSGRGGSYVATYVFTLDEARHQYQAHLEGDQ